MSDCKKIKQLKIHLKKLKNDSKYYWDQDEEERFRKFLTLVKHWKNPFAGKDFHPSPWQLDLFYLPILCIKHKSDDSRVIKTCLVFLPRKNGKSYSVAVLALYILFTSTGGDDIYIAATKIDQAKIIFEDCEQIIRQNDRLDSNAEIKLNNIKFNTSTIKPLASNTKSLDGLNPSLIIADELHKLKHDLFSVLTTGSATRPDALRIYTTTAGASLDGSPCALEYEYCEQLLEGKIKDDTYLPLIYEADEELEWFSDLALTQANPNLGVSIRRDFIESERDAAKAVKSKVASFKRYYLNRWQDVSGEAWLESTYINKVMVHTSPKIPSKPLVYGGLDISSTIDLSACAFLYDLSSGLYAKILYWIPEATMQERIEVEKIPYDIYKKEGHIRVTPGNVIDPRVITRDILKEHSATPITSLHYDPAFCFSISPELHDNDIDAVEFSQYLSNYDGPTKELERLILSEDIQIEYNPITQQCFSATRMFVAENGMQKPDKKTKNKNQIHIDGVCALIFAVNAYMARPENKKKKIKQLDYSFLKNKKLKI